ncbi:MAG: hypothetical protein AUJ12_00045 [Alphaproteobacteria bacterium CG1_02_46_17]|nr:MAG: hypothetical protein AUJ12_00045 [Alphaproteobacteria bacterium CG1_02_46_17]
MEIKKYLYKVFIWGSLSAGFLGVVFFIFLMVSWADLDDLPKLQNGDIVLHTSDSSQSLAIGLATGSLYTHMGIVHVNGEKIDVIESASVVEPIPLKEWIERGRLGRLTILRLRDISPSQSDQIIKNALVYEGRPYDGFFTMLEDKMYCSELVWRAYKKSGLKIGTLEKTGDLSLNSAPVRKLIEQRWSRYPLCSSNKEKDFESCWVRILEEDIITPVSIATDPKLDVVYSNYF